MATPHRYTACLFGTPYDVGNQGCRALAASLVKLIVDNHPDAEIIMLYGYHSPGTRTIPVGEREVTVTVVNSRMSPKARPNQHIAWITLMAFLYALIPFGPVRRLIIGVTPWLEAVKRADFIGDIRAGDSFSDIYGIERLFTGSLPPLTAILLGKPVVMLPQTYGPFQKPMARRIARFILRRSVRIYSRDTDSIALVRDILGNDGAGHDIRFCPDVAFIMEPRRPETTAIRPALKGGAPLIGINVSGLLYNGGYTGANMFGLGFDYREFTVALIQHFLTSTGARVLLVPHVFSAGVESDTNACRDIYEQCGGDTSDRVHLLEGNYDQFGIKYVIGSCDFFIGSRMHSCIAALSQGIPSVGIAYSKKFIGVFESAGFGEYVLDARKLSMDETVAACGRLYATSSASAPALKQAVQNIRMRIAGVFREELTAKP